MARCATQAQARPLDEIAVIARAHESVRYALNYGHPGVMTIPHLAMEEFLQAAAIKIKDIPFQHSAGKFTR
jgi:tripartite-type tricarboxylate transporter receptor subunit TctC